MFNDISTEKRLKFSFIINSRCMAVMIISTTWLHMYVGPNLHVGIRNNDSSDQWTESVHLRQTQAQRSQWQISGCWICVAFALHHRMLTCICRYSDWQKTQQTLGSVLWERVCSGLFISHFLRNVVNLLHSCLWWTGPFEDVPVIFFQSIVALFGLRHASIKCRTTYWHRSLKLMRHKIKYCLWIFFLGKY